MALCHEIKKPIPYHINEALIMSQHVMSQLPWHSFWTNYISLVINKVKSQGQRSQTGKHSKNKSPALECPNCNILLPRICIVDWRPHNNVLISAIHKYNMVTRGYNLLTLMCNHHMINEYLHRNNSKYKRTLVYTTIQTQTKTIV